MTEHDQDHDHDPGHDHGHSHGHSHGQAPVKDLFIGPPMDAASASLARALRMSFRLLTGIMIIVAIAFFFTGMTTVNSDEMGVICLFGRQVAVVGPGLHYTWPFPVGTIQKVSTAKQTMLVEFWPYLSPEDRAKGDLTKVMAPDGLRPGVDDALLTGDAYLFHAQIQCGYEVEDPAVYLSGVLEPSAAVRTAVTSAAVRAAAQRTAESLTLGSGQSQNAFTAQIQRDAQQILRKMGTGVRITTMTLEKWTWPIRTLPDFQAAQLASQRRSDTVEAAIGAAKKIVSNAAGEASSRKLVGEPWLEPDANGPARPAGEDYDLIGQYEIARADPNTTETQREALLARIDEILLSQATQGEVTTILRGATAYRDAQRYAAAARATNVEKLLAEYQKSPDFFIQRMWTEAREEVLQSPTVVKWLLNPSQIKTVILLNTPPEIIKAMDKWYLQGSTTP